MVAFVRPVASLMRSWRGLSQATELVAATRVPAPRFVSRTAFSLHALSTRTTAPPCRCVHSSSKGGGSDEQSDAQSDVKAAPRFHSMSDPEVPRAPPFKPSNPDDPDEHKLSPQALQATPYDINHLLDANNTWANMNKDWFAEFGHLKHAPKYLWIGCSDARVPANPIIGEPAGSVFVHRNIANVSAHANLRAANAGVLIPATPL